MTPQDLEQFVAAHAKRLRDHADLDDVLTFLEECSRIGDPTAATTFLEETKEVPAGRLAALLSLVTEELRKVPSGEVYQGERRAFFDACIRARARVS